MPEPKKSLIQKFPWLPIVSGVVLVVFVLFVVKSVADYNAQTVVHGATLNDIVQLHPTSGHYNVSGGRLDYAYAQAVGFANDKDKDAGTTYDSYVPYVEPKTRRPMMLVKFPGMSPADFTQHIDDPAESVMGQFVDPSTVDPDIFTRFSSMNLHLQTDMPVMAMYGGVEPGSLNGKIILAAILALLFGGAPWLVMYLISRPKKRRKRFSERYPERRIY